MALQEISVWGNKLRFSSDLDREFVLYVADYVNSKMKEVKLSDPTEINTKDLALRTAYIIAVEYLLAQREVGKLETAVERFEKQFECLRI
ncbi:MAG: cell division protein ZapA [Deferribacteraceae bacterium]|jgi:cell division protein ZapA (FtsZ GTPase activity inhibitor)|nr:cell division protein ZapA [Deferribacteraceae bacterium]